MVCFMNSSEKDILINRAIEKSKEAIKTARLNLDNDLLSSAQNRLYYAIFYIVTALGYKHDFLTSKHGQLISWFNKKFVHEDKLLDKELFKIYKYNFENRQKSDYDFMYEPVKEDVEQSYQETLLFIKSVEKFL